MGSWITLKINLWLQWIKITKYYTIKIKFSTFKNVISLLDEKNELYIKIDRMKTNFSSFEVLQILGITKKKIFQSIGKKEIFLRSINFTKRINKRNSMRKIK